MNLWGRLTQAPVPFRRDFDREAVERAKGKPVLGMPGPLGVTRAMMPRRAGRYIVVQKSEDLARDLLAYECRVIEVGGDLHIVARLQGELDTIVAMLQRKGLHGVLRRLPR